MSERKDFTKDPLFRVLSDIENPLIELRQLLETARYVAGGMASNFEHTAADALYGLVEALEQRYEAIKAVVDKAEKAHARARSEQEKSQRD